MGQETLNIGDSSPYPKLPFSNIPTLNGQKTVIIGENISGTPKSDDIFDGFLCAFNQDLESCKRIVEKSTGEAADELRGWIEAEEQVGIALRNLIIHLNRLGRLKEKDTEIYLNMSQVGTKQRDLILGYLEIASQYTGGLLLTQYYEYSDNNIADFTVIFYMEYTQNGGPKILDMKVRLTEPPDTPPLSP